jgi:hypothetical protein
MPIKVNISYNKKIAPSHLSAVLAAGREYVSREKRRDFLFR